MVRIKTTSFSTLKPTDLVASAQENVNAVNSIPALTGITPPPMNMQEKIDDLAEKIALARNGSTVQKNDRDAAVSVLLSYLFQWVGFITTYANAKATEEQQIEAVESTAFVPVVRGGSIGHLTAVENPRAKGLSQYISLEWSSKRGAHSYKVMVTEGYASPTSAWTEYTITTRCKVTFDAPAGAVRTFVIYPIGTAGIGDQSEYVTAMAGM